MSFMLHVKKRLNKLWKHEIKDSVSMVKRVRNTLFLTNLISKNQILKGLNMSGPRHYAISPTKRFYGMHLKAGNYKRLALITVPLTSRARRILGKMILQRFRMEVRLLKIDLVSYFPKE